MKFANPLKLLILIVCLNAFFISAICLSARAQLSQPAERTRILVLGALCYLSTASAAALLSKKLIAAFVEPAEVSASKIISVLGDAEPGEPHGDNETLSELTGKLITELETSRQRERLIADYSSDILCCLDVERRFLDLNIQSESVLEYPIISLLATPLDSLICREDMEAYLTYFNSCKIQPQPKALECRVISRPGRLIDLEWQVEWSPTLQQYFCLAKNISDRKENQRLKAEITAMVGHDLRAPVSSLAFFLEDFSSGTYGSLPPRASERVQKARENVARMLKLLNQLLDAEKLEGGQMEVDLKIIPLSELYENCAQLLNDLAAHRQIKIEFPEESASMVRADFDRSLQVLSNLVSNAIKWSPPGASIVVSEKCTGNKVSIQVTDKGPGIASDRHQSIFERFKSLDSRAEKTLASSGLGLYIARKLTELQGGSIGVTSAPGEGSTFWFSLRQVSERDLPGYLDA
jgi:signal transduction histidine kinase